MRSSTRILQAVSKWHAKSWLRSFIFPTDFSAMDRRAYTTGKIARQACNWRTCANNRQHANAPATRQHGAVGAQKADAGRSTMQCQSGFVD